MTLAALRPSGALLAALPLIHVRSYSESCFAGIRSVSGIVLNSADSAGGVGSKQQGL